jgi:hypothetical protein
VAVTGGVVEAAEAVVETPFDTTVVVVVGTTTVVGGAEVADEGFATVVADAVVEFELRLVAPQAATTSAESMAMVLLTPTPPDRTQRDRRAYG